MDKIKLDTVEEAIDEIKKGNFVIVVDDEDRENEGDLIIAADLFPDLLRPLFRVVISTI